MIFEYGKEELDFLSSRDYLLKKRIEEIGFIERKVIEDFYIALINSIISQQISTKSFNTIWNKFLNLFEVIDPKVLVNADIKLLSATGIGIRKSKWIIEISRRIVNKEIDINKLSLLDDEKLIEELIKLPGIGKYTAEMVLIFSLRRKNIFSFHDLGIRKGLMKLHSLDNIDDNILKKYKELYSPFATIASFYLWEIAKE